MNHWFGSLILTPTLMKMKWKWKLCPCVLCILDPDPDFVKIKTYIERSCLCFPIDAHASVQWTLEHINVFSHFQHFHLKIYKLAISQYNCAILQAETTYRSVKRYKAVNGFLSWWKCIIWKYLLVNIHINVKSSAKRRSCIGEIWSPVWTILKLLLANTGLVSILDKRSWNHGALSFI